MNKFLVIGFLFVIYTGYLHSLPIDIEAKEEPSNDYLLSPEAIDEILLNEKEFIEANKSDNQTKRNTGDLVVEQINANDDPFLSDYPTDGSDIQYDSVPLGGDTTKTLLSYTLYQHPVITATLNGYRKTTVLQNGNVVGGTGASIDVKQNTGNKFAASIGALRPDQSQSTIIHIAGSGNLYNATKTSVGFNAKASHVLGGSDNGKNNLQLAFDVSHKL